MKNKIEYFEWSDAWVFTSLFMHNAHFEKIDLVKIIAIGDMLNHSIFNLNELKSGLNKLEQSGLIEIKKDQIRITSIGLESMAKSEKLKGGLFEKVNNTLKTINKLKIETTLNDIIDFEFLNEEKLNIAYEKYKKK